MFLRSRTRFEHGSSRRRLGLELAQACRWVRGCGEWPGTSSCNTRDTRDKAICPESMDLANDELLWQGLCKSTWGHCSIYNKRPPLGFSFRKLYMQLDEGSLTFNANPEEGVNYFMSNGILDDSPKEIAKFIFCTRTLNWKKLRIYLDERRDVLDDLVTLHNFRNQFLPNALREFFKHIHAPEERGEYLETLITKFSHRFCACNPDLMRELGLSPDAVYVLCYSLILLSIDLTSPHVKNKMSKREFIRNTRRAAQNISEDFVGHLYDNIYLIGHVAA
ncbi:F-box only protein 8 [Podarcis lilfordi]|uniref:F-box only protein 8 n=1 Tax=Podarcis lilfordi TaxID=74358 RepID=A0AA35KUY7_9SAUR|nr:F-box only protein 8 [Podarcis lilfordi]